MKRRIFLATALVPAVSQAQQRPPLIGVMRVNARSVEQFAEPFRRDMTRLGWEEGRTYRTHFLWADGDTSLLPAMAAELLTAGATVIVTFGNAAVAAALAAARVEAVQILASAFLNSQRATFIERTREMKLPAIYEWPETVEAGGLASYAPRQSLCFRHVAVLVSKVLRGAKPADLPIEQPTLFTLAINTG